MIIRLKWAGQMPFGVGNTISSNLVNTVKIKLKSRKRTTAYIPFGVGSTYSKNGVVVLFQILISVLNTALREFIERIKLIADLIWFHCGEWCSLNETTTTKWL
jgi:hypothetical protein